VPQFLASDSDKLLRLLSIVSTCARLARSMLVPGASPPSIGTWLVCATSRRRSPNSSLFRRHSADERRTCLQSSPARLRVHRTLSMLSKATASIGQRARPASRSPHWRALHRRATYIATSNDPTRVPDSLRSRLHEFDILQPTGAQAMLAARVVATAAAQQLDIRGFAAPDQALCNRLAHLTAREICQAVQGAGRLRLTLADLPADVLDGCIVRSNLH